MASLKDWLHNHDDRWSFILPYVIIAVLLGIYASLFWVAMVMVAHFFIEFWRHRMLEIENSLIHALWHTKLDFSLVILGLALAVYADLIFGVLGLGQAARAGAAAARIGVMQRALTAFLLSVDDAGRLMQGVSRMMRRKMAQGDKLEEPVGRGGGGRVIAGNDQALDRVIKRQVETIMQDVAPWRSPVLGDWVGIGIGVICMALILVAPTLTDHDFTAVAGVIIEQMTP